MDIHPSANIKKLSLCYKLWFSKSLQPNVEELRYFKVKYSVRSNTLRLKYQRFTPSGCKNIGIKRFEFIAGLRIDLFPLYPVVVITCRDLYNWEIKHWSLNLKAPTLNIEIKHWPSNLKAPTLNIEIKHSRLKILNTIVQTSVRTFQLMFMLKDII